jgi:hypothetical protein
VDVIPFAKTAPFFLCRLGSLLGAGESGSLPPFRGREMGETLAMVVRRFRVGVLFCPVVI